MTVQFEGIWKYRSFFNKNIELIDEELSEGSKIAKPWTTSAILEVSINVDLAFIGSGIDLSYCSFFMMIDKFQEVCLLASKL